MRHRPALRVTAGGALLIGALVFLLDGKALAALAAAAAVHEAGHLLALFLLGARFEAVSVRATGPVLHCAEPLTGAEAAAAALAGPAAGLVFWRVLFVRWTLSAEMSLILSCVNLLPILPLDGGRALQAAVGSFRHGGAILRSFRVATLASLSFAGGYAAVRGLGFAPLFLVVWLAAAPEETGGLVNLRRML